MTGLEPDMNPAAPPAREPSDNPAPPDPVAGTTAPSHAGATPDADTPREALIYLGGLATGTERKTVAGVVARLENALDKADTSRATWRVHWSDAAVRRAGMSDPAEAAATIYRKHDDTEVPVIDVFQFDWSKQLMADWDGRSLFTRTLYVLSSLLKVWEYPKKFKAAGKTARGKMQLALALFMLAGMVFYAGALLFATYETVHQVWQTTAGKGAATPVVNADPTHPQTRKPGTATTWQRLTILGGLGIALLKKQGDRLRTSGAALTAVDHYVRLGNRRQNLVGELEELCERLSKTKRYSTVQFVGYSFGAIVAIDALFPTTGLPAGSFAAVRGLTTIGAPYDFVRAIRTNWREDRHVGPTRPRWINIYSPTDVLGSNFRDDNSDGEPTRGIAATTTVDGGNGASPVVEIIPDANLTWNLGVQLTFLNLLMLSGFTNHGRYWGDDAEVDHNVFDDLVTGMYAGPIYRPA
ncbi:MAG: hypothetical protein QOF20_3076 [Acidimicrobiaceae bacterium]|nr:hypothetical protein [Acidimicrobiaceae bacterium]